LEQRQGKAEARTARSILEWARARQIRIWWGEGVHTGSFVPILDHSGHKRQLFAVATYGNLEVYFQWYQYKPPFDSEEKRLELLHKLNAIEGIDIPVEAISRRPSIPLEILGEETVLQRFLAVFEWFLAEIKNTSED
jgi:hypothetical protein